jgi:hypothetical protein
MQRSMHFPSMNHFLFMGCFTEHKKHNKLRREKISQTNKSINEHENEFYKHFAVHWEKSAESRTSHKKMYANKRSSMQIKFFFFFHSTRKQKSSFESHLKALKLNIKKFFLHLIAIKKKLKYFALWWNDAVDAPVAVC